MKASLLSDILGILRYPRLIPRLLHKKIQGILTGKSRVVFCNFYVNEDCQCNCDFCYDKNHYSKKSKEFMKKPMSFSVMKDTISSLERVGCVAINFFGGEPLMSKDLDRLVAHASSRGLIVGVSTNAEYLNEDRILKLVKAGVHTFSISLDYPDKRHDVIRSRKGLYAKVIRSLRLCKQYDCDALINYILKKEDLQNGTFNSMLELAKELGFVLNVNYPHLIGSWEGKEEEGLSYQDILEFEKKFRGVVKLPFERYLNNKCCLGSEKLIVTYHGEVLPCETARISFGNVQEDSLLKIYDRMFYDPRLDRLRKVYAPCQSKKYSKLFFSKYKKMKRYDD